MVNVAKIKKAALEKGIKLSFIAEKCGVAHTYFADIQRFKRDIPSERLAIIADILGTTSAYLRDETDDARLPIQRLDCGVGNRIFMIPVYLNVEESFGVSSASAVKEFYPAGLTQSERPEKYIWITMTDESMYPIIDIGDLMLVRRGTDIEYGSVAVVRAENSVRIKKIEQRDNGIALCSINPLFKAVELFGKKAGECEILGRVMEVRKKL